MLLDNDQFYSISINIDINIAVFKTLCCPPKNWLVTRISHNELIMMTPDLCVFILASGIPQNSALRRAAEEASPPNFCWHLSHLCPGWWGNPHGFPLVDHMNCWGNHHCFSTSFSMLTLYVYFRVAGNGRSSCGTWGVRMQKRMKRSNIESFNVEHEVWSR